MSNYIRFDWAMKRLLRDKANFAVLEGFMTTLLGEKITIQKLLESESNQESEYDKYNRVDILAEDTKGELLLFEIQNNNELLQLTPFQRQTFKVSEESQFYPEYYILRVNGFNKWSKIPLEQWSYFLNTSEIPDDTTAPGLPEARERLKLDSLGKDELKAYYRHLDNLVILRDNIFTAREEGRMEGREEGRKDGREEGEKEKSMSIARQMKKDGLPVATIVKYSGLSAEEIARL